MRQEELQALQAPIKERYREDPGRALVTLTASADLDASAVACSLATGAALVRAGLHPASGGDGTSACSGDMLLQSLAACAGVTLRSVAVNRGLEIRSGRVEASGELDFRGTMGVSRDAPVGFSRIHLRFELDADLSDPELETLIATTERYCVVYQTLVRGVAVSVSAARTPVVI
jgi:uncharacterized OsmC-like protein